MHRGREGGRNSSYAGSSQRAVEILLKDIPPSLSLSSFIFFYCVLKLNPDRGKVLDVKNIVRKLYLNFNCYISSHKIPGPKTLCPLKALMRAWINADQRVHMF